MTQTLHDLLLQRTTLQLNKHKLERTTAQAERARIREKIDKEVNTWKK
jgi:hypothetical protein